MNHQKVVEIARSSGALEVTKGLWMVSADDLAKFARALIDEHESRRPKWLQAAVLFCVLSNFCFWLVYLGID